jgi:hypothetical protein
MSIDSYYDEFSGYFESVLLKDMINKIGNLIIRYK